MAAFNLTAQINLQGPSNVKQVVGDIRRQLSTIQTDINLKISGASAKNVDSITKSVQALNTVLIEAQTNANNLSSIMSNLAGATGRISSGASTATKGLSAISSSASAVTTNIKEASSEIAEFGRQSALAVRRFAAFSAPTAVIYGLGRAFTSAFGEFVKFDRQLVRLQQTTGGFKEEINAISNEITRLSTSLGVSSSDLLEVSVTLAQAGLSAAQTKTALEALAKTALSPSFDNLKDTTEGAIAAFRQFGLGVEDLDAALSSINAVAASFAVESSDIIAAIQRTGGVFASASRGVSEGTDALNEFVAVFTSVRATTRESAETIATGLRTIFTRIQRASTIDLLKEYGVELRNLEGKFVGPYEAVRRLSEGLSRIDPRSAEFAKISEELGGFRQIGKVLPLLQEFATTQQALAIAQKGQGSLTQNAVQAQQSLAVQFSKTREEFEAFVRSLGESRTFQNVINFGLTLTRTLIQLAGAFQPILPYLAIIGGLKGASAISQYATGFFGGIKKGANETSTQRSSGDDLLSSLLGKTKNREQADKDTTGKLDSFLQDNTNALEKATAAIISLENSINNKNSSGGTGSPTGFARGGYVPGSGNRDTVPAMLMPGEFVIRKKAVEKLGAGNLNRMNQYASGGRIQKFALGGHVQRFENGGKTKKVSGDIVDIANDYPSLRLIYDAGGFKTDPNNPDSPTYSSDSYRNLTIERESLRADTATYTARANELFNKAITQYKDSKNEKLANKIIQDGTKGLYSGFKKQTYEKALSNPSANMINPIQGALAELSSSRTYRNSNLQKLPDIFGADFSINGSDKDFMEIKAKQDITNDNELIAKALIAHGSLRHSTKGINRQNLEEYGYKNKNYDVIDNLSILLRSTNPQEFFVGGRVESLAQSKGKSVQEILLEQVEALGKAGGVKKALGIPNGDRELNSLLLPSNIRSGKNIERAIEVIDRALEAKGIQDAAAQQAIAEATKFGLVGLLPFDYSKQFGPEDIGGRSTYITARGVSSNYQDIIERMQQELSNVDTKYAQELQMRKIFSTSGPLVFDFDETLVDRSEDLMRLPNGKINIEGFNDLDLVQRDLQNISLTPLGQELKNRLDNGQLSLDNIRVVSARPQSNAPLLSQALSRLGLNIPESKITGTSGPEHKINNVTELETLIDDRLATVQQFHKAGRKAIPYAQLTSMSGPAVAAGQAALEGATIEKILGRLGAPLRPDAEPGRPIDYPDGLGLAAQYFGIDPNMPTEVKRTIDGSSLARTRGEIERYYKEIGASTFKSGGKVDPLIEKYKGIIRSVLPKEMISPEGFLRTPQGTSESIDIVPPVGFLDYFLFNKPRERGAFYDGNLSYKIMRKNLEDAKSTISQEDYKVLDDFINQNLESLGSRDVINLSGQEFPAILAHETFHDIQGYLLDNYPQIYSKLLQGVESKKKDIEAWYGEPGSSKWTGYKLKHIFPKGLQDAAYADVVGREAQKALFTDKRGMWPGLTEGFQKLREKSVLDLGRNEAIPMLMSAAAENNTTAQKILSEIFGSAGLNPDFYKSMPKFAVGGEVDKNFGTIGLWNEGSRISASYLKGTGQGVGAVHADSIQASRKLFSVQSSGANQGYGPKLYDVVMEAATANGGMLVSDRLSVSQDAYGVWSKYFSSRPDVSKTPLSPEDWYTGERYFDTKAFGSKDPSTWPPYSDPAWILQTAYSKQPSLINSDLVKRFAKGGSAQDTVPALLTPGEFVINKKAAQKIGYGKLHKLNKADKLQGYNKGGAVGLIQKFAAGGSPQPPPLPRTRDKFDLLAASAGTSLDKLSEKIKDFIVSTSLAYKQTVSTRQQSTLAAVAVASDTRSPEAMAEVEKQVIGLFEAAGEKIDPEELNRIIQDIFGEIQKGSTINEIKRNVGDFARVVSYTVSNADGLAKGLEEANKRFGVLTAQMKPDLLDIRAEESVRAGRFTRGNARELQAASETASGRFAEYFGGNKFPGIDQLAQVAPKLAQNMGKVTEALGGSIAVLGTFTTILGNRLPGLAENFDKLIGTSSSLSPTLAGLAKGLNLSGTSSIGLAKLSQEAGFGARGTAVAATVGAVTGAIKGFIEGADQKALANSSAKIAESQQKISDYLQQLAGTGLTPEVINDLQAGALEELNKLQAQVGTVQENLTGTLTTSFKNLASAALDAATTFVTVAATLSLVKIAGSAVGAFRGGKISYLSAGGSPFKPRGTDTVPAMLTPGEFVVNKKATQQNYGLLKSINDGNYKARGGVVYAASGKWITSDKEAGRSSTGYTGTLSDFYNPFDADFYKKSNDATEAILKFGGRLAVVTAIISGAAAAVIGLGPTVGVFFTKTIPGFFTSSFSTISSTVGPFFTQTLPGLFSSGWSTISGIVSSGWSIIAPLFKTGIGKMIATTLGLSAVISGLKGLFSFFSSSSLSQKQQGGITRQTDILNATINNAKAIEVKNIGTNDLARLIQGAEGMTAQQQFGYYALKGPQATYAQRAALTTGAQQGKISTQINQTETIDQFFNRLSEAEAVIARRIAAEAEMEQIKQAATSSLVEQFKAAGMDQAEVANQVSVALDPIKNFKTLDEALQAASKPGADPRIAEAIKNAITRTGMAGKAIAQEQFNINTIQKANAYTDYILATLEKFEQAISRSADNIQEIDRQFSIDVGTKLGGGFQQVKADRSAVSILKNIRVATDEQINRAVDVSGSQMGMSQELKSYFEKQFKAQAVLENMLPKLLTDFTVKMQAQGEEQTSINDIVKEIRTGLEGAVGTDLAQSVSKAVEQGLSVTKRGGGGYREMLKPGGLQNIIDNAIRGTGQTFIRSAEQSAQALDNLNALASRYGKVLSDTTEIQIRSARMQLEGSINLKRALGEGVSLDQLNKVFEDEIKSLTTSVSQGLPGTTNPVEIGQRLNQMDEQRKVLLARQAQAQGNIASDAGEELFAVTKQLQELDTSAANYAKALDGLATSTARASNALSKIQDLRQAQGGKQSAVFDFLKNLTNFDAQMQTIISAGALARVETGTATAMDIEPALKALEMRISVMTEDQKTEARKGFIQQVQALEGIGPALARVLEFKLLKGAFDNTSPEMEAAVKAYKQSLSDADSANKIIVDRLNSTIETFDKSLTNSVQAMLDQADASAELERATQQRNISGPENKTPNAPETPQNEQWQNDLLSTLNKLNIVLENLKNNPTAPVAKKHGGMIYASNGQYINFQPKGTDTVPAMLTPGEFVVNRKATQKNLGLLQSINNGGKGYSSGGVIYRAEGSQGPESMNIKRPKTDYEMMAENKPHLKKWLDPDGNIKEQFIRGNPFFNFNGWLFSNEGPAGGMGRIDMMKFFGAGKNNVDGQALLFSIMNGESDLKSWYGGFVKNTKSKIDQAEPTGDRNDIGFQFRPSVIEEGIDKALLYRYLYENNGRIRSGYEGPPDPLQFNDPKYKSTQGVVPLDKGGGALEAASISLARHGIPMLVGMAASGVLAPFTGGLSLLAAPIIMGVTSALTHELINQIETSQGLKDYFDRTVAQNPEAAMAGAALPMAVATAYGINQAGGISNMISGEISDRLIAGAAAGSADFATQATLNGLYGRDLNDINYTQIATSALMGMLTGASDAKRFKEEAIPTLRRGAGQFVGELASVGGNKYLADKAAKLLITEREMALFKADGDAFSLVAGNKEDKWLADLVATTDPPILANRTLGLNNDGTARAGITAGVSPREGRPGYSAAKADPKGGGHGGPAGYFTQDVIDNLEYARREFSSKLQAGYPPGAAMKKLSILRGRFTPEFLKEVENAPTLFKGSAISEDVRIKMNDALTKAGVKPIEPGRTLEDSINYFADNMGTNAASWTKFIPVTKQEAIDIQSIGRQGQFDLAIHDPKAFGSMQAETLKQSFAGLQAHVNAAQVAAEAGIIESVTEQADHYLATLDPNKEKKNAQHRQRGGLIYASNGSLINFQSRGTDTVPAMLTPGEFVVNRKATQQNLPLLKSINSNRYQRGGLVSYLQDGGMANSSGGVSNIVLDSKDFTDATNMFNSTVGELKSIIDSYVQSSNGLSNALQNIGSIVDAARGFSVSAVSIRAATDEFGNAVSRFTSSVTTLASSIAAMPTSIGLQITGSIPVNVSIEVEGGQFTSELQNMQDTIYREITNAIKDATNGNLQIQLQAQRK
jgi:TP901 family phage tail tape measure protein